MSKKEKEILDEAYLHSVFPFELKQKDKISSILSQLFKGRSEEIMFNYIVTKQYLNENKIDNISKIKNIKEACAQIIDSFILKDYENIYLYLALAEIDINITSDLNYPSIEEIRSKAKQIKDCL